MTPQPLTDTESSTVADATIDVWLLTQRDCAFCEQAKNVLGRLSHEHPLAVIEITLESVDGRALALQHGVMFAPGSSSTEASPRTGDHRNGDYAESSPEPRPKRRPRDEPAPRASPDARIGGSIAARYGVLLLSWDRRHVLRQLIGMGICAVGIALLTAASDHNPRSVNQPPRRANP